jgi:hypothetical protein
VLVAKEEEHILPATMSEIDLIPDLRAIGALFDSLARK